MSKLNPQKATAYVGPGVLRKGGKITPVPNGPLIKKKGPFKGSTLKAGGSIKKAQSGASLEERRETRRVSDSIKNEKRKDIWKKSYESSDAKKKGQDFDTWYKEFDQRTKENSKKAPEPKGERTFFGGDNGPKSPCKGGKCSGLNSSSRNGSTIKKAQTGIDSLKNANLSSMEKQLEKQSIAKSRKIASDALNKISTDFLKKKEDKMRSSTLLKKKAGGMIKRADGSYSKRGLWDNIRANKGSGKKPTAAMLKQEKKIKAKSKK